MEMNLEEDFDADAILREPDDKIFDNNNEEDISELDLGNQNRLFDIDIPEDEDLFS